MNEPFVELRAVSKRYGGVQALDAVDLRIEEESIHGLVGENGAGKSTLGKIVGGVISPDSGELVVRGQPTAYHAPRDALDQGIAIVSQEMTLVPDRSVAENIFLGFEGGRYGFTTRRSLRDRYTSLMEQVEFDLPMSTRVKDLRLADQQKVEIMRALARNARLIVMDEPTSALGRTEAEKLFAIIRRLNENGTTIVYVSHFLEDVLDLVATVTVMKDGRVVRTGPVNAESPESLIIGMVGHAIESDFPPKSNPSQDAPFIVEVDSLSRGRHVQEISFGIRPGEILGLAGLVGSGRSELARLIFGADKRDSGEIRVDGRVVTIRSPRDAVRHGIAMLPESRKEQGLVMGRSIKENATLAHLDVVSRFRVFVASSLERKRTERLVGDLDIRTSSIDLPANTLSGGNQQKLAFAKWLVKDPTMLIADEPTRGVDIGAKRAIYELIVALAEAGLAVLLISSDVEEVIGLSDRVLVMRTGRVQTELGYRPPKHAVMAAAFGGTAA